MAEDFFRFFLRFDKEINRRRLFPILSSIWQKDKSPKTFFDLQAKNQMERSNTISKHICNEENTPLKMSSTEGWCKSFVPGTPVGVESMIPFSRQVTLLLSMLLSFFLACRMTLPFFSPFLMFLSRSFLRHLKRDMRYFVIIIGFCQCMTRWKVGKKYCRSFSHTQWALQSENRNTHEITFDFLSKHDVSEAAEGSRLRFWLVTCDWSWNMRHITSRSQSENSQIILQGRIFGAAEYAALGTLFRCHSWFGFPCPIFPPSSTSDLSSVDDYQSCFCTSWNLKLCTILIN